MTRILMAAAMAVWAACLCVAQATSSCRLYLADQGDWGNNVGFYVDLEATTASDGLCHQNTLMMCMMIRWSGRSLIIRSAPCSGNARRLVWSLPGRMGAPSEGVASTAGRNHSNGVQG